MQLVGMMDSPYVRRVAVSLRLLGLKYEHNPLSVFRTFEEFKKINPVVKAPSFICDDGEVLMDSTLIIEYAEALSGSRSLMPGDIGALQHELRLIGLALAGCEKAVQIFYETRQRPEDKIYAPWLERVTGQMLSAFGEIEREISAKPLGMTSATITQAGVCLAVTWLFAHNNLPGVVPEGRYPAIQSFCAAAEALPEFLAAPFGG